MHPLFHPLFINFCAYFNGNADYFECHEELEEYWKDIAPGERLHPLVGYVQLATGMYHWRRGNTTGASRILKKATANFESNAGHPFFDYIDSALLIEECRAAQLRITSEQAFQPFKICITNKHLQILVDEKIAALPVADAQFLLHKHMLRDRSDILAKRAAKQIAHARRSNQPTE